MTAILAVRCVALSGGSSTASRHGGGSFRQGGPISFVEIPGVLKANDLTGSMGWVSSAGDNAAMGPFYAVAEERANRGRWRTRDELAYAIIFWIETPTTADGVRGTSAS